MIKKGDWVVNGLCEYKPTFGIVKELWKDGIGEAADIVCYSPKGDKIGRVSEALDGPITYEPMIPIEQLLVIEEPNFPLKLNVYGEYGHMLIPIS